MKAYLNLKFEILSCEARGEVNHVSLVHHELDNVALVFLWTIKKHQDIYIFWCSDAGGARRAEQPTTAQAPPLRQPLIVIRILEGVSRWLALRAVHRESAKVSIGYLPSTYLYLVTLNKPPYYFTILHMYTDLWDRHLPTFGRIITNT